MQKSNSPGQNKKEAPRKPANRESTGLTLAECKSQILLRHIPCEVIQRINLKKIEIMNNNPHRTTVSHSEAIYKLILKG